MRGLVKVAALALPLAFAGCATNGEHEQAGMIIGGTLGGLLGSQLNGHRHGGASTAAIIVGTLAGAAIGGSVGQHMDETDRLKAARSLENVRTGVPTTWQNPDTGVDYQFTPTRTFETSSGPCREYTLEALVGGKTQTVYGTACRQADGSWKIVK